MVTTKYNFKQWLHRTYPDIVATPIYGMPAYVLNKPLEPVHMYEYNVQTLKNGQLVVFVGVKVQEIPEMLKTLNTEGVQGYRPHNEQPFNPTTYNSFEKWLIRHNVEYMHRTYMPNMTACEALYTTNDNPTWNQHHNWYLYEFEAWNGDINPQTPHVTTENGTVVLLIKAPAQIYVSKRQRFLKHFELMQPIYEQLVVALSKDDTETAIALVTQYASTQWDKPMTTEYSKMKEAYDNGILSLFVKNIENFTSQADDSTL